MYYWKKEMKRKVWKWHEDQVEKNQKEKEGDTEKERKEERNIVYTLLSIIYIFFNRFKRKVMRLR